MDNTEIDYEARLKAAVAEAVKIANSDLGELAAALQKDNARLREALGKVVTWREDCREHDLDMGYPEREFLDAEDWELLEQFADAMLEARKEQGE